MENTHLAPEEKQETTLLTLVPAAETLDSLGTAFSVLSRLHLHAPDAKTLESLHELLDDWPVSEGEETALGLAQLRLSAELGETASEIGRDLNELYGITAKAKLPPYESVHREHERLVFGETTLQVRAAYRKFGLNAPRENRDPDDHIGLEFDFLARLFLRALHARDAQDMDSAGKAIEMARQFLNQHVLEWIPNFLGFGVKLAKTHFYRGVMHLSSGALAAVTELP